MSSSYNKLRIVFQEFGLRVLPAVNRKYQSQSGDQGVEMVSDHRGGDSAPGSRSSGAASADVDTASSVSQESGAHLTFSPASPLKQVGALMLCKIN